MRSRKHHITFNGTAGLTGFTCIIYYCNMWRVSPMPYELIVAIFEFKDIIQKLKYIII